MIRNKTKYLAFALSSILLVACSGKDDKQTAVESPGEDAVAATEASSDAGAENTDVTNEDFNYIKLECDDEKNIDLGSDGEMDSLVLAYESKDWGDSYSLKTNDQVLELINEDESNLCESVNAYFVHKPTGDYLIVDRNGFSNLVDVILYQWDNGSFAEKDRIENMAVSQDAESICEDHVILCTYCTAFGNWNLCKEYSYDDSGFSTQEKFSKVLPGYGGSKELTLKQSLTLTDENGNPTNTLEAGQKIIPNEANDTYAVGTKNTMSFVSESGDPLGYITYEYVSNGESEYPSSVTVNGINEDELFENIEHVG